MSARRLLSTILATAAVTTGLAIGLATTAHAAPVGDDFWECVADHQDTDGLGVCCVFYGGDYDERTGECWIEHEFAPAEPSPAGQTRPPVKPELPVLTPTQRVPVYSAG